MQDQKGTGDRTYQFVKNAAHLSNSSHVNTPVVESDQKLRDHDLSHPRAPVQILSAKMEKSGSRENSKVAGRLKVKGNIKEFMNQKLTNSHGRPGKNQ